MEPTGILSDNASLENSEHKRSISLLRSDPTLRANSSINDLGKQKLEVYLVPETRIGLAYSTGLGSNPEGYYE